VNKNLEIRKVIGAVILTLLWICWFLFIPSTLVIDWVGDGSVITSLLPVGALIGLLVVVFYHIFYQSTAETNKLSWTVVLTLLWLALIIFFPFKDLAKKTATEGYSGAVGFFTLMGGLAVTVLWVRFFSDEIVVSES